MVIFFIFQMAYVYVQFGGGEGNADGIGWVEESGNGLLPHLWVQP